MATKNKYAHRLSTKIVVTGLKNRMLVSARADVNFVAFRPFFETFSFLILSHNYSILLILEHVVFLQTSHGMVLLVCINVLHHVDKKALCSMSVLKLVCMSTSNSFPVCTAVINLSAYADAFVKQSAKQF